MLKKNEGREEILHRGEHTMETKDSLPEILTVREAAAYARVTPRTVQRWIEESRVPGVKVGGTVRIRRDDLLAVLTPSIDISLSSPFYNLYRPTPPPKLDKEDQLFKRDNVDGRLTASIGGISSNWGIYADGYR